MIDDVHTPRDVSECDIRMQQRVASRTLPLTEMLYDRVVQNLANDIVPVLVRECTSGTSDWTALRTVLRDYGSAEVDVSACVDHVIACLQTGDVLGKEIRLLMPSETDFKLIERFKDRYSSGKKTKVKLTEAHNLSALASKRLGVVLSLWNRLTQMTVTTKAKTAACGGNRERRSERNYMCLGCMTVHPDGCKLIPHAVTSYSLYATNGPYLLCLALSNQLKEPPDFLLPTTPNIRAVRAVAVKAVEVMLRMVAQSVPLVPVNLKGNILRIGKMLHAQCDACGNVVRFHWLNAFVGSRILCKGCQVSLRRARRHRGMANKKK